MHYYFIGSTDKDSLTYRCNELMNFSLTLTDGCTTVPCHHFQWHSEGDDGCIRDGSCTGEDGVCKIETSVSVPGFVHLTVMAFDDQGNPLAGCDPFNGGAGAQIEEIKAGYPEPEDFDDFWKYNLSLLDTMGPYVLEMIEQPCHDFDDACRLYDVKLYAGDSKMLNGTPQNRFGWPVSGYVSIPKGVEEGKTYPIRMHFMGYSYTGATPATDPECIVCLFNPHGLENGLSQHVYDQQQRETVGQFGFLNESNHSPHTVYFKGMIMRNIQTLRWAKTIKGWNGIDLTVHGESMGAFQSCSVAALCPEVTELHIDVPWMCDLGGITLGRLRGWRPDFEENGKILEGIRYYDTCSFASRVTCPVYVSAGLGDYVCPPSGVTAMYNGIKTNKSITWTQNRTHGYEAPSAEKYVR